jgi:hypothetical protein
MKGDECNKYDFLTQDNDGVWISPEVLRSPGLTTLMAMCFTY